MTKLNILRHTVKKGVKFDPDIVDTFFAAIDRFNTIRYKMHDNADAKEGVRISAI
jgi:HD-GYP domain-containing protein (c-di-GMP phosphodiesterase class II)